MSFAAIKNAIDQMYGTFLPKGSHPFVYLDLQIEPQNVDVNMHPTKHEVNFLYENEIVDLIKTAFETELLGSNETRELYTQQLLPGASIPVDDDEESSQGKEKKVYAKDMVRSDSKEQKLEKFFGQIIKTEPVDNRQDSYTLDVEDPNEKENEKEANTSRKSIILPTRTNSDVERK